MLSLYKVVVICLIGARCTNASPQHKSTMNLIVGKDSLRGGSIGDIDWRYFLAGGVCAACSHGITTPVDVVKTKMQTDPKKYNEGVVKATKDIIAKEGIFFLLAGLGPTVLGYGIEGAMKFGIYESLKPIFAHLTSQEFINFLLASVVAGAVASIILCPMEDARIRMVDDPEYSKKNVVAALVKLISDHGALSLFSGLAAMLFKQVPYTMAKQVSFDFFASILHSQASKLQINNKLLISIGAAFPASILACIFSQPGDVLLTKICQGDSGKSTIPIISNIYKKYGLAGFFLGLRARLVHVALIITTQLVIYDAVKQACGLAPTGSH